RAPAYDARAEPHELGALSRRVRLAIQLPPTRLRREKSERPSASEIAGAPFAGAAMRHLVRPHVFLEILGWIQHWTGFQQGDIHSQIGQYLCRGAAAGSRADDHHVVNRCAADDLKHSELIVSHRVRLVAPATALVI